MTAFFRFPHTPHLAWLGTQAPRGDKLLAPLEAKRLLAGDVLVEEKVDGANLGLSVDDSGMLRAQNRGSYLDAPAGQWKALKRWLVMHEHLLVETLDSDLILFGEWCYAVHGVRYARLPGWFLAFDVYCRGRGEFWSVDRRNELAHRLGLAVVPELGRGNCDQETLWKLLGRSVLTDGLDEGLYVRCERDGWLLQRAKLVRAEFVQNIAKRWSKKRLETNHVVRTAP